MGWTAFPPNRRYCCGHRWIEEHSDGYRSIGIDLGKTVCSLADLDATGAVVNRRRLLRNRLLDFLANLDPCVVAMVSSPNFLYRYFSLSLLVFQVLEVAYSDRDAAWCDCIGEARHWLPFGLDGQCKTTPHLTLRSVTCHWSVRYSRSPKVSLDRFGLVQCPLFWAKFEDV